MKCINVEISKKIKEYMDAYAEVWCFSGNVLVAKEGQVLFKEAYGHANLEHNVVNSIDTKFNIGSITKSFTAMAIMMLHEKGQLNIQDSIRKYLPEYLNLMKKLLYIIYCHIHQVL